MTCRGEDNKTRAARLREVHDVCDRHRDCDRRP
jgi:hypothetical protein